MARLFEIVADRSVAGAQTSVLRWSNLLLIPHYQHSIATLGEDEYQQLSHQARSRIAQHYEMGHVASLYLNHYQKFL